MLCIEFQEFDDEFKSFKATVLDMEQKLGSIVCQAFEDCGCCESTFKVLCLFLYVYV